MKRDGRDPEHPIPVFRDPRLQFFQNFESTAGFPFLFLGAIVTPSTSRAGWSLPVRQAGLPLSLAPACWIDPQGRCKPEDPAF